MPADLISSAPSRERRTAPRRQPSVGTVCRLTSSAGDSVGMGLVWNISTSGISMLLHERVEPGTMIRVDLMTQDESFSVPRQIQVRHISGLRTGDYIMGGQFLQPLDPDEMRRFVV